MVCYNRPRDRNHDWENAMSTPALPEESVPALTESQRLLYTFTAPSKTMADLRRNASWWVPWLLISIVSIGFAFTVDKKIGWAQVIETQIQANPKAAAQVEQLPPEQREKSLKTQAAVANVIGYAAPLMTLIALVVMAGVLMVMFNFGFGAKLRFGEMMGVAAYSLLPSILNTLLIITTMFFVTPDVFDVKNPIATSAGYFVPSTMPLLKTVLGALDVFTLWQVFLLAVGVSELSKVKKWTAFAAIFALFFLFKLAGAAFGEV
jgi:hypothetical protein